METPDLHRARPATVEKQGEQRMAGTIYITGEVFGARFCLFELGPARCSPAQPIPLQSNTGIEGQTIQKQCLDVFLRLGFERQASVLRKGSLSHISRYATHEGRACLGTNTLSETRPRRGRRTKTRSVVNDLSRKNERQKDYFLSISQGAAHTKNTSVPNDLSRNGLNKPPAHIVLRLRLQSTAAIKATEGSMTQSVML